jgi:type VI secretion system protein ImpG
MKIYEQIFAHGKNVLVQPIEKPFAWQHVMPAANIEPVGFIDEEALLPVVARSFRGYRLLHEYFTFPQRFLFSESMVCAAASNNVKATLSISLFFLIRKN